MSPIREEFVIEKKSVLPHWDEQGKFATEAAALAALPYFRKETRYPLRIVRRTVQTIHLDPGSGV